MSDERELKKGEPHPAAIEASAYLSNLSAMDLLRWKDTFTKHEAEGNRLAAVCLLTLEKMAEGLPTGDAEVLGLAWVIKSAA